MVGFHVLAPVSILEQVTNPLVFLVMIILTLPAVFKGKLYRIQGIALLLLYFAYLAFQFLISFNVISF